MRTDRLHFGATCTAHGGRGEPIILYQTVGVVYIYPIYVSTAWCVLPIPDINATPLTHAKLYLKGREVPCSAVRAEQRKQESCANLLISAARRVWGICAGPADLRWEVRGNQGEYQPGVFPWGNRYLRIQLLPDRDNYQSVTAGNEKTHVCIRQNSAGQGGEVVAGQCTHCQFGAMTCSQVRCGKEHCSTRRLKVAVCNFPTL